MPALEHRIGRIAQVAGFSALAAVYAYTLLQSTEIGIAFFLLGLTLMLLFVEPFIGLLIYLFFIYVGPNDFLPALAAVKLMLVTGGATLGSFFLHHGARRERPITMGGQYGYVVIWFFVAMVLSHLPHFNPRLFVFSIYEKLSLFAAYFLIVNLVTTRRRLAIVIGVLLLGSVALAGQGILQHLSGQAFLGQELREGRIRGIGHFPNPNMLAIGLVVAFPMVWVTLSRHRSILAKLVGALCMALLLFALYLTNSRGGMLGLGFIILLFATIRVGLVRGAALGAVFFLLIFFLGPSRMSNVSPTEASAFGRILAWRVGLNMLTGSPVFGIGADAWAETRGSLVAHNSFVHCAAELGLFGVIPYVLLFLVASKNLWYVFRNADPREDGTLALYAESVFLSLAGFILVSFVISKVYHVLPIVLLALSAATVGIFVERSGSEFALVSRRDVLQAIGITIALLVGTEVVLVVLGV